jgi:hypothetical protein
MKRVRSFSIGGSVVLGFIFTLIGAYVLSDLWWSIWLTLGVHWAHAENWSYWWTVTHWGLLTPLVAG